MSYTSDEDLNEFEDKSLWRELPFKQDSSDEEDGESIPKENVESIPNNAGTVTSPPRVLMLNAEPTPSSSVYSNALDVFAAAFSRTICTVSAGTAARQRYLDGLSGQPQDPNDGTPIRVSWLRLVASVERQNNYVNESFSESNSSVQSSAAPPPSPIDVQEYLASLPRPILGRWSPDGLLRPVREQITPVRIPRPIRGRRLSFSIAMNNPHSNSSSLENNPIAEDGDNALKGKGREKEISSLFIEHALAEEGENALKEEEGENGIIIPLIEQLFAEDDDNDLKEEDEEKVIEDDAYLDWTAC